MSVYLVKEDLTVCRTEGKLQASHRWQEADILTVRRTEESCRHLTDGGQMLFYEYFK